MTRVLVVDDEPDILLMLRVVLEASGYTTSLAADGETALQRISTDHPDLVLLDVMMPVMDGWGVLEALRREPTAPPVVVVSARWGVDDVSRAITLGAADFIAKPFDPARVEQVVAEIVGATAAEIDERRQATLARASRGQG